VAGVDAVTVLVLTVRRPAGISGNDRHARRHRRCDALLERFTTAPPSEPAHSKLSYRLRKIRR